MDLFKNHLKGLKLMKIAIITGASSGLGAEYVFAVDKTRNDIDEIWLIARRKNKLKEIAEKLSKPSKVIPLDITAEEDLIKYSQILEETKADVKLLINNAGFGKIGNIDEISPEDNGGMVRLNCEALTVFTSLTLPYMKEKSEIINTCSIASFVPNSRMAVYSSTKAYVMSFSRAIRKELKLRKINCLAVCPGPMDTEFLGVAGIEKGVSHTFDTLPRVNPTKVAVKSLKASAKGESVYTNLFFYKFYRLLAKLLPHNFMMKLAGV